MEKTVQGVTRIVTTVQIVTLELISAEIEFCAKGARGMGVRVTLLVHVTPKLTRTETQFKLAS